MAWSARRILFAVPFVALSFAIPATVGAQVYLGQWGSMGTGPGQFNPIDGIATDASGNVYVADGGRGSVNARVQKFTSTGTYLGQWGGTPSQDDGQFIAPGAIGRSASGNFYVSDYFDERIQEFTAAGSYVTQWGFPGSGPLQFGYPSGIATDPSGNVFVADGGRVQKFTASGSFLLQWTLPNSRGIATDAAGLVYVANVDLGQVQVFDASGGAVRQWGSSGSGNGQFLYPTAIAIDGSGLVYIVDSGNHRIQVFTTSGIYVTQFGSAGSGNGQFQTALDIAVDASGNVYVTDSDLDRVQKFGPVPTPSRSTSWGAVKTSYR